MSGGKRIPARPLDGRSFLNRILPVSIEDRGVGRLIFAPKGVLFNRRAVANNMIYTLNIKCVGGAKLEEPFERTIEVSDEMTLGSLHDTIQELTGFDNDHLFTFFMARGPRGQRTSVVDTGQWEEERERLYEIPLGEVFPLEQNMKLFYWFDFGDDWMFRIQQRRQPKPEDAGTEYPKVIREVGPQPVQYPE